MPVIEDLLVGMMAVILALLAFAGLIQIGLVIVRRLRLPQDPPEGAWFSPPAPALVRDPAPAEARARALAQQALARCARQAWLAHAAAQACREAQGSCSDAGRRRRLGDLADAAKVQAEAADKAWRQEPRDEAALRAALRSALATRREAKGLRDIEDGSRRKRLLLLLVLLLVAWALAMLVLLR